MPDRLQFSAFSQAAMTIAADVLHHVEILSDFVNQNKSSPCEILCVMSEVD